jgi:hypothetical protein
LVSKGISETIMNKAGRGTGLVIDIKGQGYIIKLICRIE